MHEFDWIARYFAPLSRGETGGLGLTDDVALLTPPVGHCTVLTTDTLHEGVHFLAQTAPALIAKKALRVNLSDLAAKGVKPHAYLLALSLGHDCNEPWIAQFAAGLAEDQHAFGCHLIGGDTTRSLGPLSITITMIGFAVPDQMLLRSGAKVGDTLYVSGTIGDAALGLQLLQQPSVKPMVTPQESNHLISRYHLPQPRVALGQALVGIATASMDISDGLVQDLEHLCRCSGVGAELQIDGIPTFGNTPSDHEKAVLATSGDDYELLFTAPATHAARLQTLARTLNLAITAIGHITPQEGVRVYDGQQKLITLEKKGYQHL